MPRKNRSNTTIHNLNYYITNYLQRSGFDGRHIKETIKVLIETHQNIWDIRTTLGKINIFSSLSDNKAEAFLDNGDSGNDKLITSLLNNSYKYRDCGSDPICKWFVKLHELTPKVGYNIWKGLDKDSRSFYKKLYLKRKCLSLIKILHPNDTLQLNIPDVYPKILDMKFGVLC